MSKTLVLIMAALAIAVCIGIGANAQHFAVDRHVVHMRTPA
ncbi:hypothetical protein [Tardiphaga alba]|nr:hypothetical protein [Tardiphaga alba]